MNNRMAALVRKISTVPWPGTSPGQQALLASLLGGLLFLAVFQWAYSGINDGLYQARDDGVITMSHARNLVDYGFIGVNPSGGRVEGYSAPVQFFLYAAAYAATGVSYAAYAGAQTVVATFLLGALLVFFFRESKILAVALTGLSAVFLTFLRPFLLWHGSGMENAVTHILFLAVMLILFLQTRQGQMHYWLVIPVFLASISRIESVYHIGPLLVIFGGFWLVTFRSWRGVWFGLLVLALWALFHLWRYMYFGDLLPNTAYAQNISVIDNLRVWLDIDNRFRSLKIHGGNLLLVALPALLVLCRRRETVLLVLLLGSLFLTSGLSESVFGHARLDPARTTTHLALVSALAVTTLLHCLLRRPWTRQIVPLAAVIVIVSVGLKVVPSYNLCCGIEGFDVLRQEFSWIADAEALPRPTVSNPDLGVMSWHKQFNIVDLGRLGSPLMAKLAPIPRADYFFHYAAPDIIEMHSYWSCRYHTTILADPRFRELYRPLGTPYVTDWTKANCHAHPESPTGMWIRTAILRSSESAERHLIDDMKTNLSVRRLREELVRCQNLNSGLHDCVYIARTAYRFLPELLRGGHIGQLESVFAASRTAPFDLYFITGHRDGQVHQSAAGFILEAHRQKASDYLARGAKLSRGLMTRGTFMEPGALPPRFTSNPLRRFGAVAEAGTVKDTGLPGEL